MRFFRCIFWLIFFLIISSFSQDLNNWEYCGIDSVSITAMHSFGNGHLVAGSNGEAQAIYGSHDYGKTWDTISMDVPRKEIRRFEYINNTLYACLIGNSWSTYMSKDSGKTWEQTPNNPLVGETYCMDGKDSILIAGGFQKYARSTDYGKTWETLYLCDFFADLDDNEVGAMLSMVRFRDTLYVGTQCGVFATKDWGLSWEKRGKNDNLASSGTVGSIDMIDSVIMIGTNIGVFFSYCYGGTGMFDWKKMYENGVTGNSELYNVGDSLLLFYNSHGSYLDFFWSADTGKTWEQFFLVDSVNTIKAYRFCHDNKYMYTCSYCGVWRCPRSDNVNIENCNQFEKTRPYFNNKILTISLESESKIRADLYSLSGKRITTLIDTRLHYGDYNINFNKYLKNLPTGIYLIKLNINENGLSWKIQVLK